MPVGSSWIPIGAGRSATGQWIRAHTTTNKKMNTEKKQYT